MLLKIDYDQLLKKFKLEKQKELVTKALLYASAGFVVVYLVFVVIPLFTLTVKRIGEVALINSEIRSADDSINSKKSIDEKLILSKEKSELYEKKLPHEQDIPLLLEDLSVVAKSTFIKITGINPVVQTVSSKDAKEAKAKEEKAKLKEKAKEKSKDKTKDKSKEKDVVIPKVKKNNFRQISIMISAQGGYQQLGNFVSKIENRDRFIKIDSLNIIANAANKRLHNIEMLITTFALMEE